jgi:hypothetical protein
MTQTDLIDAGAELLLAVLASASTDKIRPVDWWTRARSALETGAACAESVPEMVATMGRKLEVEVTSPASAQRVVALEARVRGEFEALRRTCERQALYVVAVAQARRQAEREAL